MLSLRFFVVISTTLISIAVIPNTVQGSFIHTVRFSCPLPSLSKSPSNIVNSKRINVHNELLKQIIHHNKRNHPSSFFSMNLPTSTTTALSSTLWSNMVNINGGGYYSLSTSTYYLARIIFLRALGFVYFIAFLIAYQQNKELIGDNGITPAKYILQHARQRSKQRRKQRQAWMDQMTMSKILKSKRNDNNSSKTTANTTTTDSTTTITLALNNKRLSFIRKHLMEKCKWKIRRNLQYQKFREFFWDRTDRMGRPLITIFWLASRKNKKISNDIKNNNDGDDDDFSNLNPWLDGVAIMGMILSSLVMFLGAANVPILFVLWLCQRSFMAIGNIWYGYGWEVQLAELGFHSLFLVPLLSLNSIPFLTPVPNIVIWTIRWYLFRIMIGAGLIKFRSGDKKWNNLTTMNYFYETQPVPNILTRQMHFMPKLWHKFEVLTTHFVETIAPFLLIIPYLPRKVLRFAGLIQILFQIILICTGNLSFLNWLTMIPAIFCFDDAYLRRYFSFSKQIESSIAPSIYLSSSGGSLFRTIISLSFGTLVMYLSIPVIQNLVSKRQQMNASFDKLRLINSYGAFGVVAEDREEFIIKSSATTEDIDNDKEWKEYEFKVKPGNVYRRPKWITPYHYRLDWQMWIASSGRTLGRSPWMYRFLIKLLQRDEGVQQLLEKDPWEGDNTTCPKYIRVDAYRYRFHRSGGDGGRSDSNEKKGGNEVPFWEREYLRQVYPSRGVATRDTLKKELQWIQPDQPV